MRPEVLVLMGLLLVPATAMAERVGLEQALREAVAWRPQAMAARQQAVAARAAADEAGSRYLPQATLSENLVWTDEPAGSLFIALNQEDLRLSNDADAFNLPPSRKDFETRLTVQQPLYDPDIAYGRRRAEKMAEAAMAGAEWSAEQAAFAAFRAYLEVQRAEAALTWSDSSRREAEETVRLAGERHAAGVGLKADLLRARVQLSEASRRLTTAKNDLILSRRGLALAMGRENGEMEIADTLHPEQLAAPDTPRLLQRADLQAATFEAEEAGLAWRQSRAAWLPRAALSASYALHDAEVPFGTDAGSWALRAGLSWELFDGGRRGDSSRGAAALKQVAETRRLEATRQARFRVEEALLRATEAKENLDTARQSMAEAEESQRLLRERYAAGLVELSELLATQTALDRARLDAVEAESRLMLALGNIRFQSGTFLQTFLSHEEPSP
jgi:outer membrane protein TolC